MSDDNLILIGMAC